MSMRIQKCYFCSAPIYPGHGMIFVRNDCKIFRFCRSKCHNNFKLRRNPRRTRWTKAFRWSRKKELTNDNILNIEKKRNIPVRYNRELMAQTIKAINRVNQIKILRDKRYYKSRMKGVESIHTKIKKVKIRKNLHLVLAPVAVKDKRKWKQMAIKHLKKKRKLGKLRLQ